MKLLLALLSFSLMGFVNTMAQSKLEKEGKFIFIKNGSLLDEAVFYYDDKDYETALPFYKELEQNYPDDVAFTYRLGVCYTYSKNEANKSLEYLLKTKRVDSSIAEIDYMLGRAHYTNYKFKEAVKYLTAFVTKYPKHPSTLLAKDLIEKSKNGDVVLHQKATSYIVFNKGSVVNSAYAEYAPLYSTNSNTLYYTMRGDTNSVNGSVKKTLTKKQKNIAQLNTIVNGTQLSAPVTTFDYNENIMAQVGNEYATPHSLPKVYNSNKHDATLALVNNKLLIYRDKKRRGSGDFFELINGKLAPLKGINTKAWEGSATFYNAGKTVVFSSIRKSGKGGKDLYTATIKTDGTWDKAQLLPTLNTIMDEDAPYFDEENNTLYFSSKGFTSIGGYDVYSSKLVNNVFEPPVNIGYPVNSIFDDIYFNKSSNNEYLFASNRTGGFGAYDIYKAVSTTNSNLNSNGNYKGLTVLNGKLTNVGNSKLFKLYAQNPVTKTNELVGNYSANEFDSNIELPVQSGMVYYMMPNFNNNSNKIANELVIDLSNNAEQYLVKTFDFEKIETPAIAKIQSSKNINADTLLPVQGPVVKTKAFEVKPIYFDVNSYIISPIQEQYLKLFALDLKQKHIPQLEIIGYTDASGNDKLNTQLSQRRADEVAKLLRQYGAKVKYWTVKGNGVYPNCKGADDKSRTVVINPVWD
jgi:outer membrane protein OmpA-like peptidoglycan-associated protein/tetratricopeptide (TPR) repeat protein